MCICHMIRKYRPILNVFWYYHKTHSGLQNFAQSYYVVGSDKALPLLDKNWLSSFKNKLKGVMSSL